MNHPIVDIKPDYDRKGQRWRQLRGILLGLKEGTTVGLRLPSADNISHARSAISNLEAFYELYGEWKAGQDSEQCNVLWVKRVQQRTPRRHVRMHRSLYSYSK